MNIDIYKQIARNTTTFCSCGCGKYVKEGTEIIRISAEAHHCTPDVAFSRVVLKEHLLDWLNNENQLQLPFIYPELQKQEG